MPYDFFCGTSAIASSQNPKYKAREMALDELFRNGYEKNKKLKQYLDDYYNNSFYLTSNFCKLYKKCGKNPEALVNNLKELGGSPKIKGFTAEIRDIIYNKPPTLVLLRLINSHKLKSMVSPEFITQNKLKRKLTALQPLLDNINNDLHKNKTPLTKCILALYFYTIKKNLIYLPYKDIFPRIIELIIKTNTVNARKTPHWFEQLFKPLENYDEDIGKKTIQKILEKKPPYHSKSDFEKLLENSEEDLKNEIIPEQDYISLKQTENAIIECAINWFRIPNLQHDGPIILLDTADNSKQEFWTELYDLIITKLAWAEKKELSDVKYIRKKDRNKKRVKKINKTPPEVTVEKMLFWKNGYSNIYTVLQYRYIFDECSALYLGRVLK